MAFHGTHFYTPILIINSNTESSVFLSELGISGETRPVSLLCWTTTPWTLPANVAISINESFKYSVVEQGDQLLIVATDRVESLEGKISDIRKVKDFPGKHRLYNKL